MKILTDRQYNEKLAEVADRTSRDIYDREELYKLTNRIEELERRIGRLEVERDYRPPANTPINPSWPIAPQPTVYSTAASPEAVLYRREAVQD